MEEKGKDRKTEEHGLLEERIALFFSSWQK